MSNTGAGGASVAASRLGNASKTLTIEEYKRRLRDNVRSLGENFNQLVSAAKVAAEDQSYRTATGRMADYTVAKYEMEARAALIIRACDELQKLTNDLKEFLILHDFNFLSESIAKAEVQCDHKLKDQMKKHNELRVDISRIVFDIDKELQEHFCLRP